MIQHQYACRRGTTEGRPFVFVSLSINFHQGIAIQTHFEKANTIICSFAITSSA